jgi:hypothetical protein
MTKIVEVGKVLKLPILLCVYVERKQIKESFKAKSLKRLLPLAAPIFSSQKFSNSMCSTNLW